MPSECAVHGQARAKRGNLAREVEQREMVRRVQESQRQELEKLYKSSAALEHIEKTAYQSDVKRKEREAKERQGESDLLQSMYDAEKQREISLIRADEEEKMTTALAKRNHERELKEREIQILHSEHAELKALTEKIRVARLNKERSDQVKERRELRKQEDEYEAAFNQYIGQVDAAADARKAEFEARRRELNIRARMVLEEQILEKEELMKKQEDEFRREREMVDEVMRRIQEEDAAEDAIRRKKAEDTKAFIQRFLEENELAKIAKAEALKAEERKIQEHWEHVRAREAVEAAAKAQRKEQADKMYEKVKRDMEIEMARREEEEYLIGLLREEDLEAKHRAQEEEKRLKAEKMRRDIILANEMQKQERARKDAEAVAEEEAYRKVMMAKFAEDDRIEQMNAQKKRMKQAEHQRAVQAMVDEKRRVYQEQKAREEAEIAAKRAEDERKLLLVEEERRKILAEAAELGLEFLPPGVIRDQRDMDFIQQHLRAIGKA